MEAIQLLVDRLNSGQNVGPELVRHASLQLNDLKTKIHNPGAPGKRSIELHTVIDPTYRPFDELVLIAGNLLYLVDQVIKDLNRMGHVDQINFGLIDTMVQMFDFLKKHGYSLDLQRSRRVYLLGHARNNPIGRGPRT